MSRIHLDRDLSQTYRGPETRAPGSGPQRGRGPGPRPGTPSRPRPMSSTPRANGTPAGPLAPAKSPAAALDETHRGPGDGCSGGGASGSLLLAGRGVGARPGQAEGVQTIVEDVVVTGRGSVETNASAEPSLGGTELASVKVVSTSGPGALRGGRAEGRRQATEDGRSPAAASSVAGDRPSRRGSDAGTNRENGLAGTPAIYWWRRLSTMVKNTSRFGTFWAWGACQALV